MPTYPETSSLRRSSLSYWIGRFNQSPLWKWYISVYLVENSVCLTAPASPPYLDATSSPNCPISPTNHTLSLRWTTSGLYSSTDFDENLAGPYIVSTIDGDELKDEVAKLPHCRSIIGLGGGQALDVAKYFAWSLQLPLFQAPTSMSVNAAFGHRTGLRFKGNVRYVCWVVPEAVYVDFDVIQNAPPVVNRSGICEILCYHTAHADWRYAQERGKVEAKWPYDQAMVDEAQAVMATVMDALDDIREVNEKGIRALMLANRWGGAAFHNLGWNPRPIEGADHFLFYALEYNTGREVYPRAAGLPRHLCRLAAAR